MAITAETIAPKYSWPSPPMLNAPALKPIIEARPVTIKIVAIEIILPKL